MSLPKVLVVEDDDAIRALLIAALRREPFEVHAAVNGSEALTLARAAELKVGDKAPDFTLKDTNWKDVKLSDYLGKKNVILAFYVLAFTGG